MPSADIRAAVLKYFTGTPGISTLSKDEPWFTPAGEWYNNGIPGTAAYVHINHQADTIVTIGGPLGQRAVTYDLALVLAYNYAIKPLDSSGDVWVDGLDALLDTIANKLRADPTLGCGANGPVWQAGIGDMDITIQRTMPIRDPGGGKVWCLNYVMFKVIEIIGEQL